MHFITDNSLLLQTDAVVGSFSHAAVSKEGKKPSRTFVREVEVTTYDFDSWTSPRVNPSVPLPTEFSPKNWRYMSSSTMQV